MKGYQAVVAWVIVIGALVASFVFALRSPLLAFRDPVYILAGLAGVIGLGALLLQPLLAAQVMPRHLVRHWRTAHRAIGSILALAVAVHVAALWFTSPPDVMDALLFASPTPFAIWGVIAMWGVAATVVLAVLRRRIVPRIWRLCHVILGLVIVLGTVVHALLIEGTMEPVSKAILCMLIVAASIRLVWEKRAVLRRSRG